MSGWTGKPYREGELEVILSMAPTKDNIFWLSKLLERSEKSIQIVYKIAFEHGSFGKDSGVQEKKIIEAKERIGLAIGRKKPRNQAE